MSKLHPNNLVPILESIGYGLSDLLPAYPGKDIAYVDRVLRDNACALSRPVISYGMLGIHPVRTAYFNMTEHGHRWIGEDQPWPPDPRFCNIFFFGGSTALGYNIEDRHTISSFLHRALNKAGLAVQVYNFGGGNYSSRHVALYFLNLLDQGVSPDVAVFLDGFNDSYYAFGYHALVKALDQLYQSEKRRRRSSYPGAVLDYALDAFRQRHDPMPNAASERPNSDDPDITHLTSPAGISAALADTSHPASIDALSPGHTKMAGMVWRRWLDSNAVIRALAREHHVRTLFAWQPVPLFATLPSARIVERVFGVFPNSVLCSAVYKWLHAAGFPDLPADIDFLDLSRLGEDRREVGYVDMCHYSGIFTEIIAENLASALMPIISRTK